MPNNEARNGAYISKFIIHDLFIITIYYYYLSIYLTVMFVEATKSLVRLKLFLHLCLNQLHHVLNIKNTCSRVNGLIKL